MSDYKRVAISIAIHSHYGREAVQGMFQHVRAQAKWEMDYESVPNVRHLQAAIKRWKAQGLFLQLSDRRIWKLAASSGLPAVNISGQLTKGIANVCVDNVAVGLLAAKHLVDVGLKHFGFYGPICEAYMFEREAGFKQVVSQAGCELLTFHLDNEAYSWDWRNDNLLLVKWLDKLPKPVGLMACNDFNARQIVWACRRNGIQIPNEVAIIGVDNDTVEGSLCDVALSTVDIPARTIGQRAAELLDEMMIRKGAQEKIVRLPPLGVIARESTNVCTTVDPVLLEVVRFIRDNTDRAITVSSILNRFAVSRRSLEIRFQKAFGRTLGGEILKARLERAQTLLRETDLKITGMHEACGFARYSYFSQIFRRKVGVTPAEYRRRFRAR